MNKLNKTKNYNQFLNEGKDEEDFDDDYSNTEIDEMTKELGKLCNIIYNEYYLPNCKSKPVSKMGFF